MKTIGMIGGMSWESSMALYMMSYAPESSTMSQNKTMRILNIRPSVGANLRQMPGNI